MVYPDEFCSKILELLPLSSVKTWLRNGDEMIGQVLKNSLTGYTASEVIDYFNQDDLELLLASAIRQNLLSVLYEEWKSLKFNQHANGCSRQ